MRKLRRATPSELGYQSGKYLLLVSSLVLAVLPFVYVLSVSFRPSEELYAGVYLLPRNPTLEPWMVAVDTLRQPLMNSTIIAVGTATLSLLITIPGAYVFGRKQFPGKRPMFYLVIAALLFPYILLIIPIADLWDDLGLYNTIPGMWLAYQVFVTPFAIWILRDFFEQLPPNLEEAAQVYGCTQFSAFMRVVLPVSMPAIVAVGFLAFLTGWNDFLFSNMLTTGTGPRPAVVELFLSTAGSEQPFWTRLMAQTLIIGLPPTVLYIVARRKLSEAFAV